ncbi:glycosyltransferase [Paenibacillus sp. SYP-B4298]|uniref:glycosyltransferase n=1 Tax=Paenibacillus sp. SYP-B4298 TaxID=2996034 RepID=UPI0022DE2D37|nr:glycosyltransferase [Paenibacillus sp. SYP-B4298]
MDKACRRSRIAIISQKLLGHVIPALGIGQALAEREHDVYFMGHLSLRSLVEGSLVKFVEIGWGMIPMDFISRSMVEISERLRELDIDLLIVDSGMPAPAYCAESLGIPWVSFQTSVPLPDELIPGIPSIVKRAQARYADILNHARRKACLPLLSDERRMRGDMAGLSPYMHLVMVYPEMMEHWEGLPPNTEVIGACAYVPLSEPVSVPDNDRPSVLICSSSLSKVDYRATMTDYIDASIAALEHEPVNLLLSDQSSLRLRQSFPANLHFYDQYPIHDQLFPLSSAVITHGGCNTIQKAMRYGVPLLIIPLGDEQPLLASRCEKLGIAVQVDPDNIQKDAMGEACLRLLEDDTYSQAADRLREQLQTYRPNESGATLVERVLYRR